MRPLRGIPGFEIQASHWKLLKWSLMIWATIWTLIFQLGQESQGLPDFVYVNF